MHSGDKIIHFLIDINYIYSLIGIAKWHYKASQLKIVLFNYIWDAFSTPSGIKLEKYRQQYVKLVQTVKYT
jgi:hypothetical protein